MFELFQHASSKGLIESNPAMEMILLALPKKPTQHNSFLRQDKVGNPKRNRLFRLLRFSSDAVGNSAVDVNEDT